MWPVTPHELTTQAVCCTALDHELTPVTVCWLQREQHCKISQAPSNKRAVPVKGLFGGRSVSCSLGKLPWSEPQEDARICLVSGCVRTACPKATHAILCYRHHSRHRGVQQLQRKTFFLNIVSGRKHVSLVNKHNEVLKSQQFIDPKNFPVGPHTFILLSYFFFFFLILSTVRRLFLPKCTNPS